jgi:hypothetical protein
MRWKTNRYTGCPASCSSSGWPRACSKLPLITSSILIHIDSSCRARLTTARLLLLPPLRDRLDLPRVPARVLTLAPTLVCHLHLFALFPHSDIILMSPGTTTGQGQVPQAGAGSAGTGQTAPSQGQLPQAGSGSVGTGQTSTGSGKPFLLPLHPSISSLFSHMALANLTSSYRNWRGERKRSNLQHRRFRRLSSEPGSNWNWRGDWCFIRQRPVFRWRRGFCAGGLSGGGLEMLS